MSKDNEWYEFFGEAISYSRKQALQDGVLVNLNQFIPVPESGYKYPVACTIAVWGIIEKVASDPKYGNDYEGIVWDILQISRNCPTKKWTTGCLFQVVIIGAGPKKIFTFKIDVVRWTRESRSGESRCRRKTRDDEKAGGEQSSSAFFIYI